MTAAAVILGGAGFVGTNLADALARRGARVRVFDNFSRAGAIDNARWLRDRHRRRGEVIEVVEGDVCDPDAVASAVRGASSVFHLAAQVAVTTSLAEPARDFAINAGGTIHVLEALRAMPTPPPVLFTSTNKVYGDLDGLRVVEGPRRYDPADPAIAGAGIGERQPLGFHTPYGCSKGAADQYVLDYARCYGVPAVVFRMSCIYGPHQRGTEDQGWVAHFCLRALRDQEITVYGDGKQVRDLLYAADLVEAMLAARERAGALSGRAFNIGGTPRYSLSLLELLALLERRLGRAPLVRFEDWRPRDQRYYASDVSAFAGATGWRPRVPPAEGVSRLIDWLRADGRRVAGEPAPMEVRADRAASEVSASDVTASMNAGSLITGGGNVAR